MYNLLLYDRFLCRLQDPDTSPPSCSAARVIADCPAICNESSWSVSLVVSDNGRSGLAALQLQKGGGVLTFFHSPPLTEDSSGETLPGSEQQHVHKTTSRNHHQHHHQHHHHHYQARLKTGEPPLNISEWARGLLQPLWVRYTSSCCSTKAEMLVWDTAGNMKRCHLTSVLQRKLTDRSTEISGTGQTKVTGFIFLLLGLLWSPLS